MTEIFTAKTVDEAKALAAKKFGKNVSEIRFEVIEEGKKGLFGIGKTDAKVKATYNAPAAPATAPAEPVKKAEAPQAKKEEAPALKEKAEKVKAEIAEKAEEIKTEAAEKAEEVKAGIVEKAEEVKAGIVEKAEEVKAEIVEKAEEAKDAIVGKTEEVKAEKQETAAPEDDENDYSLDNFTLIEENSLLNPKVKIAIDYITSILRAMEIDAEFKVYQNETAAVINIESDNNGTIIGRRGETLDSMQYLCSIIANKGDKDYFRITIDCLGYRSKRKETLEQLAAKVARSVLKTGRSQPLEPMNPYERRVIHSAISKIEGVSSRSVGEEPYRKIIISSNNPRMNGKRRGGRNDRNDRGDRRNNRRRNNREPFVSKAIDVSTSFEKDYKKPKPEDTMEGGLYGKIEL